MKKLRNLFLAVLVLIVSVFTVNTLAAEKGSITITNATKNRTYEIYKIFDLTYQGEGDNKKVAYTIDEDWVDFFNENGSAYIVDDNNTAGTLNPITIGSTTKYINITEDNKIAFANAALEYAREQVILTTQVIRQTAAADGELEFADLELGYYLVYPVGATIKTGNNLTVASIDSTLKDLRITLKATYPTLEKDFHEDNNTSTYDVGSVVKFVLNGQVPDTTGFTSYTYTIHDVWSDGLAYDESSFAFEVKVGETILDASQYTLTVDATNRKFDLELGTYIYANNASKAGQAITVTYGLVITEDAIAAGPDYNQAQLEYSNNPKNTETSTTDFDPEYVYSSKVVVTKVDGSNQSTTLAGAKFVLKNSEGKYYYYDEENDIVLWVSGLEATENEPAATVLTTPANGVVEFKGLKDGTYFLVETEAPLGFNKLPEPVEVSIAGKVNANNVPVAAITNKTVKNFSGAQLPSTGGFGTKLFVIIGSLLAMISGVVLVTNKRMAKEEM